MLIKQHFLYLVVLYILLIPQTVISASVEEKINALIQQATVQQTDSAFTAAQSTLQQALTLSEDNKLPTQQALTLSHLGDIATRLHQYEQAQTYLEQGLIIANTISEPRISAHLLNNYGNFLYIQEDYLQALHTYQQVIPLAEQQNEQALLFLALTNQIRTYLKLNDLSTGLTLCIDTQQRLLKQTTDTFQYLNLSEVCLHLLGKISKPTADLITAHYRFFNKTLELAKKQQNKYFIAQAKGFLGELYYYVQRYPEAMRLTREAIFLSQTTPDLLYQWEWQQGKILQAQQELTPATQAYQRALDLLQKIRIDLTKGQRDTSTLFHEHIRPVYFSLADVLLQRATTTVDSEQKTHLLNQARDAVEQLKAAELQDYFQDTCVSTAKVTKLDGLDKQTAVLYPIPLPDRIELLVSLPDGIHQVMVNVPASVLNQEASTFQEYLQMGSEWRFAGPAKQLYQWLIEPIYDQLVTHHINTLVVVPDAALRMIPFAALVDAKNNRFLIQDFALVTTPGLNLTDPRPLPRKQIKILLGGLSSGVQNFSPLPHVPQEIADIKQLFDNSQVLLDQTFLIDSIDKALKKTPYTIVHIASHGQFDRNPKKTFLLTYDDKLTMDKLENLLALSQLRKNPVELLTLSACQTAVGDERAALGLAGVAIKAGARSALASLWFVNDESTSKLVTEFYQQLKNPVLSKAQALQQAQKSLMEQGYQHPLYWAPFLLIGNWL